MSYSADSRQSNVQRFFLTLWFGKGWFLWLFRLPFLPLSLVYQLIQTVHRKYQRKRAVKLSVPVVVVGNITVGGTGKTPVVIALANALTARGLQVGIISRGYGSAAPGYPYWVQTSDTPSITGDEPLLMAQKTQCPVVIGKDRVAAARFLLEQCSTVNIILSDDGLQHYRLYRDREIIIADGQRGLGNHLLIPAGPLRESASRLASVDWVLFNSPKQEINNERVKSIHVVPCGWQQINSQKVYSLDSPPWWGSISSGTSVEAFSGIGNPQRFFETIKSLGIECCCHAYDDHYRFTKNDFADVDDKVVLMTEKDAVKCLPFAGDNWWALMVEIDIPETLINDLYQLKAS